MTRKGSPPGRVLKSSTSTMLGWPMREAISGLVAETHIPAAEIYRSTDPAADVDVTVTLSLPRKFRLISTSTLPM